MIRFDILTIFPQLFEPFTKESLLAKASKKKLLKIQTHDLRKWTTDKHRSADDKPFGGGLGMVMRIEPIYRAVSTLKSKVKSTPRIKAKLLVRGQKSKVILFTPRGKKFTQEMAYAFSKLDQLIMICGRYEGIDERVTKYIADEEISMGDYVLMGGEVPAMAVIESVSRLIPGVIGKPEFLKERLGKGRKKGFIEYPQYTRPEVFIPETRNMKHETWRAPKVLMSGNHKKIKEWKRKHGKLIGK